MSINSMGWIEKLRRFFRGDDHLNLILNRMDQLEYIIMSKISEFADRQNAFNDRMDVAVTAITADIAGLNELIRTLQTTPGPITPEDQATLDALEARGAAVAAKLDALDSLTAPVPPTA